MKRRTAITIITAVLAAVVLGEAAYSGGQTYVDKRRVIRAGVLRLIGESGGDVAPAAPYIFYILGMRDDLKPHGWTFVNPLASGSEAYKNTAGYWMVSLRQTTLENLAKFDILYMSAKERVMFPMKERDKLRRFVDGGGCLWVDNGGGGGTGMTFSTNPAYAFFLPGVGFTGPSAALDPPPAVAARLHPLVTNPFWLSPQEIASLDLPSGGKLYTINPGFSASWGGTLPGPTILPPVVVAKGATDEILPTVAAIEYGSGRIVFTAGFVGGKIEGPVTGWSSPADLNPQNSNLFLASQANLRFAYNVVSWAASYTTLRKEYRRTGVSLESIGAPLVNKWKLPGAAPPSGGAGAPEISPVIYKNVIFYSAGGTLFALDASPENDLDMDGNPDDGEPDPNFPQQDIIWAAPIGATISSPVVATMLDPTSDELKPKDFVLVTCVGDPLVRVFEAFPQDEKGRLSGTAKDRRDLWQQPSATVVGGGGRVLPPVVQNGWIYAVSNGYIYGHSPVLAAASGQVSGDIPEASWACPLGVPGTGDPPSAAEVKSGPVFGFIRNQTNGAIAQMLCVVGRPPAPTGGGGLVLQNDCIYTLPVFVSSDLLTPDNPSMLNVPGGTTAAVPYRTTYATGLARVSSYPEPQAWGINPDGGVVDVNLTINAATPGIVTIQAANAARPLGPSTRVYMTYALDYSLTITGYFVPSLEIPPKMAAISPRGNPISLEIEAASTPALGPNDAFYVGVIWNTGGAGGSGGTAKSAVDAITFDGNRGAARLKWSWVAHGGGRVPDPSSAVGGASAGQITIPDIDPATGVPTPGGLGIWGVCAKSVTGGQIYPVRNLEVRCTPAVTNDRVFVTATTTDPGSRGLSRGYLLCLKSDPTFTIRLNRPLRDQTSPGGYLVQLWQPDLLFDPLACPDPPITQAPAVPADMIDYDTGTITITDFTRIRLRGSSLGMGAATNTLTPSLPVWVFVNRQPVPLSEVDLSSWDNLLWSLALPKHGRAPCSGVSSSPVVLGDYVYFTCDDGYMYAVAVDAVGHNKMLDPSKEDSGTWMPMSDRIDLDRNIDVSHNTGKVSVAGAGGVLAVPCKTGLYVFNNPLTLVTDNHRVLEIGGDGKVSWACDAVYEPKEVTGAVTTSAFALVGLDRRSLEKPTVAQKFGPSDYLVVESGGDRVIRMDRGGQVTWNLSEFTDPKNLLRSGEPKTLKAPSDAKMWTGMERVQGPSKEEDKWFYLIHCLVADTGNFRILDIVDRYEATAQGQIIRPVNQVDGRAVHELNWVSETSYKEKRLMFNCVQLVTGKATNSAGSDMLVNQVWASALNYGLTGLPPETPQAPGGGHLGGAIVSMRYRESTEPFVWTYVMGEPASSLTGQLTTLKDESKSVALSGPTYFRVLDSTIPRLLICDSSAVYVTREAAGVIERKITADDYAHMTRGIRQSGATPEQMAVPIPFSPQMAELLPGDRLIVVNGYAGRTYEPSLHKFTGEVFEINLNDRRPYPIKWYTPEIWDEGGELLQKMPNAPNLDQPTCALRLF